MPRGRPRKNPVPAHGADDANVGARSNGIDKDVMDSIVGEVKAQWEKLEELRAQYMNKCKGPRAEIAEIIAAAKEQHGVGTKALKAYLRDEADLLKIVKREKARRAKGGGIEDEVDQIRLAAGQLAETPFGQWLSAQVG